MPELTLVLIVLLIIRLLLDWLISTALCELTIVLLLIVFLLAWAFSKIPSNPAAKLRVLSEIKLLIDRAFLTPIAEPVGLLKVLPKS